MVSDFLTAEELASYLKVDIMTVYRLAKNRKIPASKVGHLWRFKKTEIDEWFRSSHVNGNTQNN
ncbi:MAG: DNA-binding protein [Candidatus Omnitrophica bacterium CG07_land_8_20_14_0_80_42_15]|uniref:DNA-binding protein n=1 Tax=Candidatus Aquitaenariimonas noxiae TaxID=1974741 RepID=A0A2J0KQH6_9BACT|nr:MAG: DNA-binding protein [Candidatus Omnitrophica bacterium CG07_land_8_20_14_0_80_42_15]